MSTIQELFQQAQLAEAAYSNFVGMSVTTPKAEIEDALMTGDGKFSDAQAAAFANTWQVIDHIPDTAANYRGHRHLTF